MAYRIGQGSSRVHCCPRNCYGPARKDHGEARTVGRCKGRKEHEDLDWRALSHLHPRNCPDLAALKWIKSSLEGQLHIIESSMSGIATSYSMSSSSPIHPTSSGVQETMAGLRRYDSWTCLIPRQLSQLPVPRVIKSNPFVPIDHLCFEPGRFYYNCL